jgi:hypothetical protein
MCGEIVIWASVGLAVSVYAYVFVPFMLSLIPRWFWFLLLSPLVYYLLTIPIG